MLILSLHSLQLNAPLDGSGDCLVLTELILPRNAIRSKSVLTPVQLSKGRRSFVRAPFYEKALLKEKVESRFGLKVSVTRPLPYPQFQQLVRQLLATGVESSIDLIAPLLSRQPLAGDLIDEVTDFVADKITDRSPAFIAVGGMDLDRATLASGKIAIPLKLTETIRQSDLPPGPKSREKRKSSTRRLSKGTIIGEISLDLFVEG